jgi:hypothetical protein
LLHMILENITVQFDNIKQLIKFNLI